MSTYQLVTGALEMAYPESLTVREVMSNAAFGGIRISESAVRRALAEGVSCEAFECIPGRPARYRYVIPPEKLTPEAEAAAITDLLDMLDLSQGIG